MRSNLQYMIIIIMNEQPYKENDCSLFSLHENSRFAGYLDYVPSIPQRT